MGFLSDLLIRIGADSEDLKKELRSAKRELSSWSRELESVGSKMTAAITLPLVGVGAAALKVAGELEQNTVAFKTMLGSADAAQKHLEDLRQFALRTPFQFNDVVVASKRLQALGFEAKSVIQTLTTVGDAASALGLGAEGIQRIVMALGQMKAKGTIQAEEMRQLAEAGIPAWEMLAKTLNTTVADAMKQVEKRAVDSATAVPALLAQINERFGGLMVEQSKTFLGQLSNLKDALTFTLQDVGKSLMPVAKNVMETVLKPMLDGVKELAAGFAAMPPGIQTASIALAGFLAAVGPVTWAVGGTVSGLSSLIGLAMKLPALLNPVALGIAAIGTAAAIAFYELKRSTKEMSEMDKKFSDWVANEVRNTKDFEKTREMLNDALEKGAISASAYNQALIVLEDREKKAVGTGWSEYTKGLGINIKVASDHTQALADTTKTASQAVEEHAQKWAAVPFEQKSAQAAVMVAEMRQMEQAIRQTTDEIARSGLGVDGYFAKARADAAESMRQGLELTPPSLTKPSGIDWTEWLNSEVIRKSRDEFGKLPVPIKAAAKEINEFQRQIDRSFNRMARGIADSIMDWKGFGKTLKEIARDTATGFLEIMIRQLLKPLEEQFTKLAGMLGGWLKLGGGNVPVPGGSRTPSVPGGGGGGGIASAAGGLTGTLTAIGSIGSMVSGIIGNFQNARMEGTMNAVELNTRKSAIYLGEGAESIHQFTKNSWLTLVEIKDYMWKVQAEYLRQINDTVTWGKSKGNGSGVVVNFYGPVTGNPQEIADAIFDHAALAGAR